MSVLGDLSTVHQVLIGIYSLLLVASGIVAALSRKGVSGSQELVARVKSWWWMIGVFTVAILIGPAASVIFLGFLSFLALKEYFSLIPTRRIDREVLLWAYLAVPLQFYWVYSGWYGMFIVFIPVWMFLFLSMVITLRGETDGFLRAVGTYTWGLMIAVFALSHLAGLMFLGREIGNPAGGAGLLLFLVFLTQFNDVAQFTWGKIFGRHAIVPKVSPKKTWEGFLGGLATTTLLAVFLGPFLTVMDPLWSAFAGAAIAAAGFIGDVTISALKRDLKVKDSSGLIPGHGGILDRVDSLTYAAPAFFHIIRYFYA